MGTILLVDENPLRASMRRSLLEGCAPRVVRAVGAADAFCLIESQEFARDLQLVVVQHEMLGLSGVEFVAELRRRLPHIPVLVLSDEAGAERTYQAILGVKFAPSASAKELGRRVRAILAFGERQYA